MESKNNKELIDFIKAELKGMEDIPYREGAWESFREKHTPVVAIKRPTRHLWVVAAVAAVVGFGILFLQKTDQDIPAGGNQVVQEQKANKTNKSEGEAKSDLSQEPAWVATESPQAEALGGADNAAAAEKQGAAPVESAGATSALYASNGLTDTYGATHFSPEKSALAGLGYAGLQGLRADELAKQADLRLSQRDTKSPNLFGAGDDATQASATMNPSGLIMAQEADPNFANQQMASNNLSPKKKKLTDRFELGAFLSPSRSTETYDVGGGLLLAYKLNDKLSVRTGASFNQYEVGILASEMGGKRASKGLGDVSYDSPATGMEMLTADIPYRANSVMLPNLNSVTGKVQTLDIPIELKYNINRQFYVSGGVSSAIVLSQERYEHLTEYTGALSFSSESNTDRPVNKEGVTATEKTQLSTQENVNTNGFGGFVNLSIGRKTNISRKLNLSIEPFVKLPVGQFKRADMNYTNGGIKVITSF